MVDEGAATPPVEPKPRRERKRLGTRAVASEVREAALAKSMSRILQGYLNGRRLVTVKIRLVEGKSVDGFLKITGEKGERLLVDFKATATPQGQVSSLQVGARNIPLEAGASSKRSR